MNVIRVLMVCVAFVGGVGTASSDDALPAGAILRLGSTKLRQPIGGSPATITPDGRSILHYQLPSILRYISVETGKETHTVELKERLTYPVYLLRITRDGRRLIVNCHDRISVVDPHTGETLWSHLAVANPDLSNAQVTIDAKAERYAYAMEQQDDVDTVEVRVLSTRILKLRYFYGFFP